MKIRFYIVILLIFFPIFSQAAPTLPLSDEVNTDAINIIQTDLNDFVISWNEGNAKDLVKHYKKANSTTLISTTRVRGYKNIAAYFRNHFTNKAEMGTVTLSHIEVNLLSSRYAMATGDWSVKNSQGKNLDGVFSILYEDTLNGWKIALDHTSII